MKLRSLHLGFAALAAAAMLVFMAPPLARAFTIDEQSATNFDGSPKFVDPDRAVENFGRGGSNSDSGNGTIVQYGMPQQGQDRPQNWVDPTVRPFNPWANPGRD